MKKLMKKESDVLDSQVMKTDLTPLSAAISGSLHQFDFPYYQSLTSKEMCVLEADCFPSRYKLT